MPARHARIVFDGTVGYLLMMGEGLPSSSAPATASVGSTPKRNISRSQLLVLLGIPALLIAMYIAFRDVAASETIGDCLVKARATSISSDKQALGKLGAPRGGSIEFKGQSIGTALAQNLSDDVIREGINACRQKHVANAAPIERPTLVALVTVARGSEVREEDAIVSGHAATTPLRCTQPTDRSGRCELPLPRLPADGDIELEATRGRMFLAKAKLSVRELLERGSIELLRDKSTEPIVVEVVAKDCKGRAFRGDIEVRAKEGFVWDAKLEAPPQKTGEGRSVAADRTGRARFNAIIGSLKEPIELTLDPADDGPRYTRPIAPGDFHDRIELSQPCKKVRPLSDCSPALVDAMKIFVKSMRPPTAPTSQPQTIYIRSIVGDDNTVHGLKTTGDGETPEEKREIEDIARKLLAKRPSWARSCRLDVSIP